jgi:lysophospholipase L1-like esterase
LVGLAIAGYVVALFLAFDVAYSTLIAGAERPFRIADQHYHHGLAARYDGYDLWGERRYRVFTNNLGLKDASDREVAPISSGRRILLIGDSFTEGIGLPFEETFAGMLTRAGQERGPDTIEFLNAGVSSYSPSIYYKKVKHLLDAGIRFGEVVVFSDPSDVHDEATAYFCIDDDPKYQAYCDPKDMLPAWAKKKSFVESYLSVTNATGMWIMRNLAPYSTRKADQKTDMDLLRLGWLRSGSAVEHILSPLGVEGGVARSLQNMEALANLLKAKKIPLTIVVYPWPSQLDRNDHDSRQISLWREFCRNRCRAFINLFPAFFAAKERDPDWRKHLLIGDGIHFSEAGNAIIFHEIAKTIF